MLKRMKTLPTINGQYVSPGEADGWDSLSFKKRNNMIDFRLGLSEAARGVGYVLKHEMSVLFL